MNSSELNSYGTKWLFLDAMCMGVPIFSDTCHGLEVSRWRRKGRIGEKGGEDYSSAEQWFTGKENSSDEWDGSGNWDMLIDLTIGFVMYMRVYYITKDLKKATGAFGNALMFKELDLKTRPRRYGGTNIKGKPLTTDIGTRLSNAQASLGIGKGFVYRNYYNRLSNYRINKIKALMMRT